MTSARGNPCCPRRFPESRTSNTRGDFRSATRLGVEAVSVTSHFADCMARHKCFPALGDGAPAQLPTPPLSCTEPGRLAINDDGPFMVSLGLLDQLGSDRSKPVDRNAEHIRDVTAALRSRTQTSHGPQEFPFAWGQPVKTNPKEVRIQPLNHCLRCLPNHPQRDGGGCSAIPCQVTPLSNPS